MYSSEGDSSKGHSSGFFSKLADGATGLCHSAERAVSGTAHSVGGLASGAYDGAVSLANKGSGYIQRAEHGVTRGLHTAEDWVDQGSHALAGRVADVPGLGFVARGLADQATTTSQLAGGMVGGAATMVGGLFNAALHPIDTMAGVEAMIEHTPGPLGTKVRAAHDLIDVARGRRTVGGMINRAVNPFATMQEDQEFWGRMGGAIIDPYRQSIKEGRYGEAVGRGVFDIGSMLLGVGEVGEAARSVGVAGDVARAGEVADVTRAASTAGETTGALGVTTDATRVAETTANTTRSATVTEEARAAGEGALSRRSEPHVAPPESDMGLADRGCRSQTGERSMTKEKWQAQERRRRAEQATSRTDQPLEPVDLDKSWHGHGHADHGHQTTAAQQGERLRTGITPSGRQGKPVSKASSFHSPEAEAEALGRGRRQLQADQKAGKVSEWDASSEPNRHTVVVPTNRKDGYGYRVVKQKDAAGAVIQDSSGLPLTTTESTPLRQAKVVWEYVPSKKEWRPVTYFPE